jgi:hypothetical protein
MANCYALKKDCKRAGERLDWGFNWTHELSRRWEPYLPYAAAVAIRPSQPDAQTGLQYSSSGGQSGSQEPAWPDEVGDTVLDGTITWTAEALSTASLNDQISASVWDAEALEITVDDEDQSVTAGLQETSAYVAGGTARRTYDIVNTVTTLAGKIFEGVLRLRIDP